MCINIYIEIKKKESKFRCYCWDAMIKLIIGKCLNIWVFENLGLGILKENCYVSTIREHLHYLVIFWQQVNNDRGYNTCKYLSQFLYDCALNTSNIDKAHYKIIRYDKTKT